MRNDDPSQMSTDAAGMFSQTSTDAAASETPVTSIVATTDPAIDAIVDAWFADTFHGLGPRLDEFLYNHAFAAAAELKRRLAGARITA